MWGFFFSRCLSPCSPSVYWTGHWADVVRSLRGWTAGNQGVLVVLFGQWERSMQLPTQWGKKKISIHKLNIKKIHWTQLKNCRPCNIHCFFHMKEDKRCIEVKFPPSCEKSQNSILWASSLCWLEECISKTLQVIYMCKSHYAKHSQCAVSIT